MKRACAILFLLVLVVVASSCNKTPEPTPKPEPTPTDTIPPVTPNDTIPPVTPNDTIVPTPGVDTIPPAPGGDTIVPVPSGKVVNFCYDGGENFPPLDSIRRYANDPEYDTIYIIWGVSNDFYWTPVGFNSVRDSLRKRFDISSKVYGKSFMMPYQILPDADSTNIGVKGMIQSNKDQYERWHYDVWPVVGDKNTKKP